MLIIFGGLPGTGKTTIARELARQIGAIHLRIDSIERAIRDCSPDAVGLDEAGYRVAYAVAEDTIDRHGCNGAFLPTALLAHLLPSVGSSSPSILSEEQ